MNGVVPRTGKRRTFFRADNDSNSAIRAVVLKGAPIFVPNNDQITEIWFGGARPERTC